MGVIVYEVRTFQGEVQRDILQTSRWGEASAFMRDAVAFGLKCEVKKCD